MLMQGNWLISFVYKVLDRFDQIIGYIQTIESGVGLFTRTQKLNSRSKDIVFCWGLLTVVADWLIGWYLYGKYRCVFKTYMPQAMLRSKDLVT